MGKWMRERRFSEQFCLPFSLVLFPTVFLFDLCFAFTWCCLFLYEPQGKIKTLLLHMLSGLFLPDRLDFVFAQSLLVEKLLSLLFHCFWSNSRMMLRYVYQYPIFKCIDWTACCKMVASHTDVVWGLSRFPAWRWWGLRDEPKECLLERLGRLWKNMQFILWLF